jgi:hypothetical protein
MSSATTARSQSSPGMTDEPVDLTECRGCGGRGIRDGMEIARLTAICRKSDCGPLENELAAVPRPHRPPRARPSRLVDIGYPLRPAC